MTPRIQQAIDLASIAHDGHKRKLSSPPLPYVAHVFAVAWLLSEEGATEDVVIAGLFHDVLEDRPDFASRIESFGPEVLEIVQSVTEIKYDPNGVKLPWNSRKAHYLKKLRDGSAGARAVACADKIHNIQSLLESLKKGTSVWDRFNAPKREQIDFFHRSYQAVSDAPKNLRKKLFALIEELENT